MTEYKECQDCGGYCCSGFGTPCGLDEEDVKRIADGLEIPLARFKQEYVIDITLTEEKPYVFKQGRPCRFWTQGRCGIHAFKPKGCTSWKPYSHSDYVGPVTIYRSCSTYFRKLVEEGGALEWWKMLKSREKGGWKC